MVLCKNLWNDNDISLDDTEVKNNYKYLVLHSRILPDHQV